MRRQPTTAPLMMSGRKNIAATSAASLASWAAPPRGDDVAEQPAAEDQLNGRTGKRANDHRRRPGEREHDKSRFLRPSGHTTLQKVKVPASST